MELDDELCLCFHVSKRKVINYVRIERPGRASQLSECYGAGTGCGWCRPFLERIFRDIRLGEAQEAEPDAAEYRQGRSKYVRAGGGTPPPGATPVDPEPGV